MTEQVQVVGSNVIDELYRGSISILITVTAVQIDETVTVRNERKCRARVIAKLSCTRFCLDETKTNRLRAKGIKGKHVYTKNIKKYKGTN